MTTIFKRAILVILPVLMFACTKKSELGSEDNPVKFYFIPSVDSKTIEDNSKVFKAYLEKNTPYKFDISVPQSYAAVVEAFGTKRADMACLTTFPYIIANEKYGVEARLTVLRNGDPTYKGMLIVKSDSKIKTLEDLNGKKVAFTDPASTSGYLLPSKLFKDKNITPKETVFAMKHDNVVTMVYQGQVDAGAVFYTPPHDGKLMDARRLVLTQYPDVESKIRILDFTADSPNDPITFRKDMPEEMKTKITEALVAFVATEEGKKAFENIYTVNGLKVAKDSDYDSIRDMLKTLNVDAEKLVKK